MTVYIDNAFIPFGRMIMCHMMGTDLEELHQLAQRIGMKKEWFQDKRIPHYDVSKTRRELALKEGAVEINIYDGIPSDVVRQQK